MFYTVFITFNFYPFKIFTFYIFIHKTHNPNVLLSYPLAMTTITVINRFSSTHTPFENAENPKNAHRDTRITTH